MSSQELISSLPVRLSLRGVIKFSAFISLMVLFLIHHTLADLLILNQRKKLKYFLWSISRISRVALRILNVKVSSKGVRGEVKQRLIVANHLSYLDVLILFSEFPSLFVTSVEIRETFLLGRICRLAGCFFVERRVGKRSAGTKTRELQLMRKRFSQGFNVFLFPEGTSSDGTSVLPFKGTFFQLSVDSNTPVVPVCLKYTGEERELVPWYGKMTFPDHLLALCHASELQAKLSVLPEISGTDKMALAREAQTLIKAEYEKS